MKKEALRKAKRGSVQKTSDEKVATLKNAKGLVQKTSDKKEATSKKCKGASFKRPHTEKEAIIIKV
jgi:hypothetical protein